VEHAITEAVAGIDLVRAQLLVASGEPLPWPDGGLEQRGHAIEARVYAEDPASGFLPQAGRLLLYREPHLPGIRIDAGVVEGGDVPIHYDPMLAKVIASAETRDAAIARLAGALRAYPILGVRTNIPFLLRILEHPQFRAGDVDTGFLDREGAAIAEEALAMPAFVREAVASLHETAVESGQPAGNAYDPWIGLQGWRA
jgi:acetyl/propionyl-CoA carboxylase alpha subunit